MTNPVDVLKTRHMDEIACHDRSYDSRPSWVLMRASMKFEGPGASRVSVGGKAWPMNSSRITHKISFLLEIGSWHGCCWEEGSKG